MAARPDRVVAGPAPAGIELAEDGKEGGAPPAEEGLEGRHHRGHGAVAAGDREPLTPDRQAVDVEHREPPGLDLQTPPYGPR